ncbi:tetratricopeptide repeat protein [Bacillus marinisedimentorum]|uniref:tetratricopeptide repeat protein n=1 Tax=Bacillus marinisedimentorum TaxID=1821260 RepID=UPI0008725425|nr:tetratricopeptide repeat protein [Bacillus marinisedimentorum]
MSVEQEQRANDIRMIEHLFGMERYEDASPYIEKLLGANPEDGYALYLMGVVHLSRGDYRAARELVQEAIRNGYDEVDALSFIGTVYRYENNYREAERAYLRSLELDPEQAEVHALYGYLMMLTGHDAKAVRLLDEALKLAPDSDYVNTYAFRYYLAKGDKARQAEQLQRVLETSSSEVQRLVNLAIFHVVKNDKKAAREYYRQAFMLDPADQNILSLLEELDRENHPIFFTDRLMEKIGGPAVLYIGFAAITFLLFWLGLDQLAIMVLVSYIILAVYSWVSPLLYKMAVKGRV